MKNYYESCVIQNNDPAGTQDTSGGNLASKVLYTVFQDKEISADDEATAECLGVLDLADDSCTQWYAKCSVELMSCFAQPEHQVIHDSAG